MKNFLKNFFAISSLIAVIFIVYCAQSERVENRNSPEEKQEMNSGQKEAILLQKILAPECKENSACREELDIYLCNKHRSDAELLCQPRIEKLAKYQFEWKDSVLESKFPNCVVHQYSRSQVDVDKTNSELVSGLSKKEIKECAKPFSGTVSTQALHDIDCGTMKPRGDIIRIWGSKIMFQNGFGAWKNMTYRCEYDVSSKEIVDYSAD